MSYLVLVRHGQSQWNLENRFTGWTDVPITDKGRADAKAVGAIFVERNFSFDAAFTSRLQRANETLDIILEEMGQTNIPITYDSPLNERHYGDLQGLNKAETAKEHGEEQVRLWRRSYDTPPPGGESIHDCAKRTGPFFREYILPLVAKEGKNIIITAHGNSLRPIIQILEGLPDDQVASIEIGCCEPRIYTFEDGKVEDTEVVVLS